MFKKVKKIVSILSIGAVLSAGSMATAPQANAGLIFCPFYGVGLVLVIIGIYDNNLGLVILANSDGSANQDSLSTNLMNQYSNLGMSNQAANDVAGLIKDKAKSSLPDANGKVSVNLSAQELSQGLQASNVENDNPALFKQLVTDLK